MNQERVNEIVESLKHVGKECVVDEAFQLLIDNQILPSELGVILNKFNYVLPDSFYELSLDEMRLYHQHHRRLVIDLNPFSYQDMSKFNAPYFYELVDLASKNKSLTELLIRYIASLDNMPLYFLGMEHIKIKNINFALMHSNWMDEINNNKIRTIYDFLIHISNMMHIKNKAMLISQFKTFMGKPMGFNLDTSLDFVKFVFSIELILSDLSPKIRNTIKVKFLLLKPEWLKDNYYNKSLENGRSLIYKHKKKLDSKKIKILKNTYSKNQNIIDSFGDNGYRAIYYSLIEGV